MGFWNNIKEKLNPAQRFIAEDEGGPIATTQTALTSVASSYDIVEVVNRCVNILVDNSAMVDYDVKEKLDFLAQSSSIRGPSIHKILNRRPNPYMDKSTFRRLIMMDFLIDGNAFIHFDGVSFYHLPAHRMEIIPDAQGRINHYTFDNYVKFKPNEVVFVKDNSARSTYRGDSRINSALTSLFTREFMTNYQSRFFQEGTAVGLIVETENILSKKMKDRQEKEWMHKYSTARANNRPLILDAGLKAKTLSSANFREMEFTGSIKEFENKVAMALGVPPLLLDSGNNANIRPNMELLFYLTIMPMLHKFESAFEYFFSYDVLLTTHSVPALKPDAKEESERLSALVNNGILTGNEARAEMRLDPVDDPLMEKIRIPANVAGSGTGVSGQEGGRPEENDEDE